MNKLLKFMCLLGISLLCSLFVIVFIAVVISSGYTESRVMEEGNILACEGGSLNYTGTWSSFSFTPKDCNKINYYKSKSEAQP